jgi:hypothetical protein
LSDAQVPDTSVCSCLGLRRHPRARHDAWAALAWQNLAETRTPFQPACGLVWAACYHWSGCFSDFATSFYYSATSYSTVGYGDVNPPANWRIVGAIEAVTGILMFGWSTGVLFSTVNYLLGRFKGAHPPSNLSP